MENEIKKIADRNGWIAFRDLEPTEEACLDGKLLAYHVFNGCVAVSWSRRHDTEMYTHWQPMPAEGWVPVAERYPEGRDANSVNCILARHELYGITTTGWHRLKWDRRYSEWQRTPEAPENIGEYKYRFL